MARQGQHLGLEMRQALQQGLAPLQLQYARLLAMPGPEVEEEVARALDDNPALEAAPDATPVTAPDAPAGAPADAWYRYHTNNRSAADDTDDERWEPQLAAPAESLAESLDRQLGELPLTPRERRVAREVTGNLDGAGYLRRDPADIALDLALEPGLDDVDTPEVRRAWATVRSLDPPGVGAIDLRDCLLLQIDADPRTPASPPRALAREILAHYFDLFSAMNLAALADALNASSADIDAAIAAIRTLNPKPGGAIDAEARQAIAPDLLVEPDPASSVDSPRFSIQLLASIPELQVAESFSPRAEESLRRSPGAPRHSASDFIRSKRRDAELMMQALAMRSATLTRVMKAIVKLQQRFFVTEDPADLRPMILRDVAALTGDDLSVVSRATAGKYVATPRAVYPLKHFFSVRPKPGDEASSARAIEQALRAAIEAEDSSAPLTDDALAALLQSQGHDIARRTVSKYRERLGYPTARLRRLRR